MKAHVTFIKSWGKNDRSCIDIIFKEYGETQMRIGAQVSWKEAQKMGLTDEQIIQCGGYLTSGGKDFEVKLVEVKEG